MTAETIDEFALGLLEEAKRFLEKAKLTADETTLTAYLHSALMIGFCALEAHVNSVADDMAVGHGLTAHEKAVLQEKEVRLENGKFALQKGLKIYRLEDRIMFLYARFSTRKLDTSEVWWSGLRSALKLRNQLTHPKSAPEINLANVTNALNSVIEAIDQLYRAVYKKSFPAASRGLHSLLDF